MDYMFFENNFPIEEIDYNYLKAKLRRYKNVRVKINDMLKKNQLIRVKKGIYVLGAPFSQKPFCRETLSNIIYGPSCISLHYALSFYGLIPESVQTVTAITNKRNKSFDTPVGRFTYRYIHPGLYHEGVVSLQLDERHNILIASKEKALADLLYFTEKTDDFSELENLLFADLRLEYSDIINFDIESLLRLSELYGGNVTLLYDYLRFQQKKGDE
jgi:predicted transcriptional regulator of viral defense system